MDSEREIGFGDREMPLGLQEILLIFLLITFLFGAKRITKIAKEVGQAFKEFREAKRNVDESLSNKL